MKRVGDPEADYSDAAESKNVQTAENPPLALKLYDIGALPTPVTNFFTVGHNAH
jgi:hypothetical protein